MVRADIVSLNHGRKICLLHTQCIFLDETPQFSARASTRLLFASFSASHPHGLSFHAAAQKRRASVAERRGASRGVAGPKKASRKRRGSVAEASRKRRGASRAQFLQVSRKRRASVAERRGPQKASRKRRASVAERRGHSFCHFLPFFAMFSHFLAESAQFWHFRARAALIGSVLAFLHRARADRRCFGICAQGPR